MDQFPAIAVLYNLIDDASSPCHPQHQCHSFMVIREWEGVMVDAAPPPDFPFEVKNIVGEDVRVLSEEGRD